MKLQELRQIIREEISKSLKENQLPSEVENLIKQYRAKDIYDLVDILKKKGTTIAKELNVIKFPFKIKDKNGNIIYYENSRGVWYKQEYNSEGNLIYGENSKGFWEKREYDSQGNEIYYEDSTGTWYKREYNSEENIFYFENSDGYWEKREYNSQGNRIYYENSDGYIEDNR